MPGVEQELPRHGEGKIAISLLEQQEIAKFPDVPQIGELVSVALPGLYLAGEGQPQLRLTDQVERHIRERQILLKNWPVPAPFGHAMAENEAIVAQPQDTFEQRIGVSHHICPRLSGIWKK